MTDQTQQQTRKPTPEEDIRELYSRVAKLNDRTSALLAPAWGSEVGIIPSDHPLYVAEEPTTVGEEQAAPVDWEAIARQRERELKQVGEARHRAETELARLRAGEEDGWDPAVVPTPGQWIERWNRASPEMRLHVAERVIADADTASRCFLMAHEKRLANQRAAAPDAPPAPDGLEPVDAYREAIQRVQSSGPRPTAATEATEQQAQPRYRTCRECGAIVHYLNMVIHMREEHRPDDEPDDTDTTEAPATVTDPAWLREQYAAAVEGCGIEPTCDQIADAVLRVRDRHLEQIRQRLELADAEVKRLQDWYRAATRRAETAEADRDRYHDELACNETDRVTAVRRADTAEQQRDQLAAIVRDFLDPDPCQYDHHGYCQAHGNLSETRCPHARAREILAQLDQPKEQ